MLHELLQGTQGNIGVEQSICYKGHCVIPLGGDGFEIVDVEEGDLHHDQKDNNDYLFYGILGKDLADLTLFRLKDK